MTENKWLEKTWSFLLDPSQTAHWSPVGQRFSRALGGAWEEGLLSHGNRTGSHKGGPASPGPWVEVCSALVKSLRAGLPTLLRNPRSSQSRRALVSLARHLHVYSYKARGLCHRFLYQRMAL